MDCSRMPHNELRSSTSTLQAGHMPHRESLYIRSTRTFYPARDKMLKKLRKAVAARKPPVKFEAKMTTRVSV